MAIIGNIPYFQTNPYIHTYPTRTGTAPPEESARSGFWLMGMGYWHTELHLSVQPRLQPGGLLVIPASLLYKDYPHQRKYSQHIRCGYGSIPINTIFNGMNIHLPAILMFTRGTRFWHTAISQNSTNSKGSQSRTPQDMSWNISTLQQPSLVVLAPQLEPQEWRLPGKLLHSY